MAERSSYQPPTIEVLGTIAELTQAGASHSGYDGKYYDQKGYFGSVIRPVDDPTHGGGGKK